MGVAYTLYMSATYRVFRLTVICHYNDFANHALVRLAARAAAQFFVALNNKESSQLKNKD